MRPDPATNPTIPPEIAKPLPRPWNAKINVKECYRLRKAGTPLQVLADRYNVTKAAVSMAMKPFTIEKSEVEKFKEERADMLAGKQRELLSALTINKTKDMSGRDIAVSFGILYDKERLERGQSTHNLAHLFSLAEVDE